MRRAVARVGEANDDESAAVFDHLADVLIHTGVGVANGGSVAFGFGGVILGVRLVHEAHPVSGAVRVLHGETQPGQRRVDGVGADIQIAERLPRRPRVVGDQLRLAEPAPPDVMKEGSRR